MKRFSKAVALSLALGVLPLGSGCIGPFNTSGHVKRFNDEVSENKWWRETVFLTLIIIPVYELAWLGDALIFNSIEFWGGQNPISSPSAAVRTFDLGSRRFTIERVGEDGVLDVRVDRGGETVGRLSLDPATGAARVLPR